ncbi:MAG: hypothetical protein ACK2UM_08485 [Anaerolineales bacterium]|jgi:uncharacterized membrane protein YkvA (DUF1232 family)
MSDKRKSSMVNSGGGGVFNEISNLFKLVFRLMRDRRVNPFLKLIPIATVIYLVIPDLILGPIDDAAIIGFGLFIFVELCPQHVVEEHRAALAGEISGQWRDSQQIDDEDVVEAEFTEDEE